MIISTYFLINSYFNFNKIDTITNIIEKEVVINNFLLQLSRERDLTSLYIASNYKNFSDILYKQRDVVDRELTQIEKNINVSLELSKIRGKIDSNSSKFRDIFFNGYGKLIQSSRFNNIAKAINLTQTTQNLYLISILNQINIAKESSGIERGFISYFMEKRDRMSEEDIEIWNRLKIKSNSFYTPHIIDKETENEILKISNSKLVKEILLNIEDISNNILIDSSSGKYKSDTSDWFTFQTQKITFLSKMQFIILIKLDSSVNREFRFRVLILAMAVVLWILIFISSIWYFYSLKEKEKEIPLILNGEDKHFEIFITVLTKIAYSTGRITKEERDVINYTINNFISIGKNQGMNSVELIKLKEQLNNSYMSAKRDVKSFLSDSSKLEDSTFDLKVIFLKQLISMASIENYSVRKKMMIYEIVEAIGFDKLSIQKYINDIIGKDISEVEDESPYDILGCSINDTDETVKNSYIKLIKEFHPDYIQGKGLNDEIIKFAEQKLKKLNNAYDEIKKARK